MRQDWLGRRSGGEALQSRGGDCESATVIRNKSMSTTYLGMPGSRGPRLLVSDCIDGVTNMLPSWAAQTLAMVMAFFACMSIEHMDTIHPTVQQRGLLCPDILVTRITIPANSYAIQPTTYTPPPPRPQSKAMLTIIFWPPCPPPRRNSHLINVQVRT